VLDPTILRISQPAARNAEGYRVLARARNSKFQSRKSRAGYFLSSRSLDPKIRPRFRHPPSAATTPDSKREKKAANGSRNGRQGEDFSAAEFSDAARSYVRFPAHRGRGGEEGEREWGGLHRPRDLSSVRCGAGGERDSRTRGLASGCKRDGSRRLSVSN